MTSIQIIVIVKICNLPQLEVCVSACVCVRAPCVCVCVRVRAYICECVHLSIKA